MCVCMYLCVDMSSDNATKTKKYLWNVNNCAPARKQFAHIPLYIYIHMKRYTTPTLAYIYTHTCVRKSNQSAPLQTLMSSLRAPQRISLGYAARNRAAALHSFPSLEHYLPTLFVVCYYFAQININIFLYLILHFFFFGIFLSRHRAAELEFYGKAYWTILLL